MKYLLYIASFLLCVGTTTAQLNTMRFGISARPILPIDAIDIGPETLSNDGLSVTLGPRTGFNFGMFIQKPITKLLALETGIYTLRRNYRSTFSHTEVDTSLTVDFALVGYEIPVHIMMYVQLGGKMYMSGSTGLSFDMFPSDVFNSAHAGLDTTSLGFNVSTQVEAWMQIGLSANYGFEYRSDQGAGFYLGASLHRPFTAIGRTRSKLEISGVGTTVEHVLNGAYLSMDMRFTFPEAERSRRRP